MMTCSHSFSPSSPYSSPSSLISVVWKVFGDLTVLFALFSSRFIHASLRAVSDFFSCRHSKRCCARVTIPAGPRRALRRKSRFASRRAGSSCGAFLCDLVIGQWNFIWEDVRGIVGGEARGQGLSLGKRMQRGRIRRKRSRRVKGWWSDVGDGAVHAV